MCDPNISHASLCVIVKRPPSHLQAQVTPAQLPTWNHLARFTCTHRPQPWPSQIEEAMPQQCRLLTTWCSPTTTATLTSSSTRVNECTTTLYTAASNKLLPCSREYSGARAMATPRKGSEITKEWLEVILTKYEARTTPDASVQIITFLVNPGADPGDNFHAEVIKVAAEGDVRGVTSASNNKHKHYNLFVKFLLGNAFEQQSARVMNNHIRELIIYSDIIAELNDFQANISGDKYRIYIPEFVYGICTDDDYVLVMKNLSTDGYVTRNKHDGLDLPHILMATDRLARLHAVSYSFYKSHDFFHKYPSFIIDERWINMMKVFVSSLYDCFIKAAAFKKDEYKMLFSTLESNREALAEKLGDMTTNPKKLKIPCLAHGDYWTNNMMFQYANDVSTDQMLPPHNMMMIDWGNTMFRDPLLDLQYLIYTSTTLSLRKQHLEEILHHYHSTFTAVTNDLGVRVDNWEFQDFMEDWKKTRYFGCIMGTLLNTVTLSKAGRTYKMLKGSISSNKFKAKIEIRISSRDDGSWLSGSTSQRNVMSAGPNRTSSNTKPEKVVR
ncbi:hypothetical protein Pcinc_008326 [Petrolisthes cinctipes]|uniref:CHK kinase-like domain-containing protein n=1 Tax=Petrolisthes cinctipes TaxID=88211 RepID=A0AAE1G7K8_PETCI|nr:hypothetical protein Pcinc_008326 [Petrolisthes cinctipes]